MTEVSRLLMTSRLVTLTGAGGVGKTRLAIQVAAQLAAEFGDGVVVCRSGPDHRPGCGAGDGGSRAGPARSARPLDDGHLTRFIARPPDAAGARQLRAPPRAGADLDQTLFGACPALTLLATSREPIRCRAKRHGGCRRCRSPTRPSSCSPTGPTRPARTSASPGTTRTRWPRSAVDSTACRSRSNSPPRACARCHCAEIVDGLHDRFRLLTGGARTAVRRQQTLRASVDWSHALLSEPERTLFRRLGRLHGRLRPRRRAAVGRPATASSPQVLDQLASWWTSRSWRPRNVRGRRGTGCWKPSASTRSKSSANQEKPTPSVPATAITTRPGRQRSRPRWTRQGGGCPGRGRDRQSAGRIRVESRQRRRECAGADVDAGGCGCTGPAPGRPGVVRPAFSDGPE